MKLVVVIILQCDKYLHYISSGFFLPALVHMETALCSFLRKHLMFFGVRWSFQHSDGQQGPEHSQTAQNHN